MIIPGLPVAKRIHSRVLQQPLAAPRFGVMIHYDDSSRDDWSLEWFQDPRCTNGYTWLVLRDGQLVELADPGMRTPHAGVCRTPNANSAFYGISAATNGLVPATQAQIDCIVECCRALFVLHGWHRGGVGARIVGHDEQAIYSKVNTTNDALWGRLGRKVDPTGQRTDGRPILDVREIRARLARS